MHPKRQEIGTILRIKFKIYFLFFLAFFILPSRPARMTGTVDTSTAQALSPSYVNSFRISAVTSRLLVHLGGDIHTENTEFFNLCLSLARCSFVISIFFFQLLLFFCSRLAVNYSYAWCAYFVCLRLWRNSSDYKCFKP